MSAMRDAALVYQLQGLTPIPLLPRSKRPAIQWMEFQHRRPSAREVLGWFEAMPEANVGLVMGNGMFAVDIDGAEGALALTQAGVMCDRTMPCSKTARGWHYFFAGSVPDRVGLLPHVDVRGVGYVVAPPSVRESGYIYTWEQPLCETYRPATPPPALMALLARPQAPLTEGLEADKWLATALCGVGQGERDITCFRLASYFNSKGIPADVINVILQQWATFCDPPFPAEEVEAKVESATRRRARLRA